MADHWPGGVLRLRQASQPSWAGQRGRPRPLIVGARHASPECDDMSLFATKSLAHILKESEGGAHQLKRTLGPFNLVALGIGAIIGAGLFSLTGVAAGENAGPAVVLSFIIAAIGCGLAGLCYSELAAMIPVSGSAYTYAQATLGELVAWIIGWDLVLEYAIGAATVSRSEER